MPHAAALQQITANLAACIAQMARGAVPCADVATTVAPTV
eukprot:CAMPEP_0174874428 /NCGR_PEP_ID=MMETSP1114-20130205/76653_1 /TAXON_ID=312471 /ORGANISM="Neobodo designis, Strain CCAP 1951/1" /LENGTH=39 /DNA_ID= /DNA_START= /DNA_END= /DNA_ORIENTATION=